MENNQTKYRLPKLDKQKGETLMYSILQAIMLWEQLDQETKVIITTATIISIAIFWLLIYSAVKAAMEKALENSTKKQSNYELALQVRALEKHIAELQKNAPKE